MTSFLAEHVKAMQPLRDELAADVERFKAGGGEPKVLPPQKKPQPYVSKTLKQMNDEKRERLGIKKGVATLTQVRERFAAGESGK